MNDIQFPGGFGSPVGGSGWGFGRNETDSSKRNQTEWSGIMIRIFHCHIPFWTSVLLDYYWWLIAHNLPLLPPASLRPIILSSPYPQSFPFHKQKSNYQENHAQINANYFFTLMAHDIIYHSPIEFILQNVWINGVRFSKMFQKFLKSQMSYS